MERRERERERGSYMREGRVWMQWWKLWDKAMDLRIEKEERREKGVEY